MSRALDILFLSPWFPYPADNGSKLRILHLLRSLAQGHRVTLVAADESAEPGRPVPPALAEVCRRVVRVPWQPHPALGLRRAASLVVPRPEWVLVQASPEMRRAVAEEVGSERARYDLVVASEMGTAIYARELRGRQAVLDDLELGAFRRSLDAGGGLRRLRGWIYWWKLRRAVPRLVWPFAACTVVSAAEGDLLRSIVPGLEPEVIPNCVDVASYAGVRAEPQPDTLVFSGSLLFPANYEAAAWFLGEIWPLVRRQRPRARLQITGKHGTLDLPPAAADPQVILTGFVDDVRPVIAGSWGSIVPLRTGGGTRLKILEAMALGTPVVATPKAIEGLDVVPGEHVLVAEGAADFAGRVVELLTQPELRARLAANGRRLVADRYDWSRVGPQFVALCERVAAGRPAAGTDST